ncbi:methylamine utilization protein [uncultured Paraglaciecola sp.]|uniref:methylamine utilization protein n=1 Tax=uncultured Paraglaciecola sp. TaxID=1765024 RepID=UPI00262B43FF|nr:methylamine utilization protein [uncultured Paraglaciecola sp.]
MNASIFASKLSFGVKLTFKNCLWIVFMMGCSKVFAESIRVVDQFGNPVENAVISFNEDAQNTPDISDIAVMDQVNVQFSPEVLVIQKNQQVSFPNSDNTRHHIYSFSKPKPFEIKMYHGGESKQLAFEQSGIVVLGCNIHDQMIGYIYVAENENTAITNKLGIAQIPKADMQIKLWHPRLSTNKITRQEIQLPTVITESPFSIQLTLVEEVLPKKQNTFKSKKSWKRK